MTKQWWNLDQFVRKKDHLKQRMALIKAIRRFFDEQAFWEVETPILQVTPAMDTHIHGFSTAVKGVDLQHERTLYLHTSPEFAMKKLMVAGIPKMYQICHVFRNGEGSRLHSPEFTMLEWYRAGSGYEQIMEDCINLLRRCAEDLGISSYRYQDFESDPFAPWQKITVAEAFETYTGIDLIKFLPAPDRTLSGFTKAIQEAGIRTAHDDGWDDLFFRVMGEKIEPRLGQEAPAILYDYPAHMASLSRKKPDDPRFAERFELYVCGIELANAFGELTDAEEQRQRFIEDMDEKERLYGERYPLDEEFLEALEYGLPESGGIALGVDRLAMLASGADDIEQVLWTGRP